MIESRLYELSRMPLTFAMTETLSGQSLYLTRTMQPSRTQTCSPLELMGAESEFVFFMYFAPFLMGCSAVFATRPGGMGIQRAAAGAAVIAPQCRFPYTAGLPPSPRERVSKYLYPPRFHCKAACQSRFWGRVHRSSSRRHRAAPHVADRLQPRRFCARCTVYSVVGNSQKMFLHYIGSENAVFTTSGQIFFDFAQSLRHRLLRASEHAGRLRL